MPRGKSPPAMLTEGQRHCLQDVAQALELERDGEVDRWHRQLFTMLLANEWQRGLVQAIEVTLIGNRRCPPRSTNRARRLFGTGGTALYLGDATPAWVVAGVAGEEVSTPVATTPAGRTGTCRCRGRV